MAIVAACMLGGAARALAIPPHVKTEAGGTRWCESHSGWDLGTCTNEITGCCTAKCITDHFGKPPKGSVYCGGTSCGSSAECVVPSGITGGTTSKVRPIVKPVGPSVGAGSTGAGGSSNAQQSAAAAAAAAAALAALNIPQPAAGPCVVQFKGQKIRTFTAANLADCKKKTNTP